MKKKKWYNEIRTYATSVDVLKISSHFQNGLRVLAHVVLNVTEKHWNRDGQGRRYYKDSTTIGHFRHGRIHHKNEF